MMSVTIAWYSGCRSNEAVRQRKKPIERVRPAFQSLAPHRGHISNFLYCAFARAQGGFRERRKYTDILNLYSQLRIRRLTGVSTFDLDYDISLERLNVVGFCKVTNR